MVQISDWEHKSFANLLKTCAVRPQSSLVRDSLHLNLYVDQRSNETTLETNWLRFLARRLEYAEFAAYLYVLGCYIPASLRCCKSEKSRAIRSSHKSDTTGSTSSDSSSGRFFWYYPSITSLLLFTPFLRFLEMDWPIRGSNCPPHLDVRLLGGLNRVLAIYIASAPSQLQQKPYQNHSNVRPSSVV